MAEAKSAKDAELAGIKRSLDIAVRLLSAQLTRGMTRKEAILTLSGAGLGPKEVSDMLGISSNQVSVALYDAKQSGKRKQATKRVGDPSESAGAP
jgi:DNA-binding CsgD family transcriptional regulator